MLTDGSFLIFQGTSSGGFMPLFGAENDRSFFLQSIRQMPFQEQQDFSRRSDPDNIYQQNSCHFEMDGAGRDMRKLFPGSLFGGANKKSQ
jgi:hypothetical protein